jgi:hypothetical protein
MCVQSTSFFPGSLRVALCFFHRTIDAGKGPGDRASSNGVVPSLAET